MAVSLGEIANIKGDADLAQGGFGTDAILPENNTALAYLANAANLHAGANKYLADVHNQRLQDYLKNFQNIDLKNLAPGDYDPLSQQYIDLSKDLADNYDVIQNPLKDRDRASALFAREAALRSQISQSQMDRGVMDENNKFIQAHPDFNTPEYQKNVQDFWNAPLGQRKPFALNPAYVFNPADVAKKAYDTVKQKYATATTDGKYVMTAEGIKAAAPAYLQAYNALLNSDDAYGRTARSAMLNAWNHLAPDDKALYNNDPQKWSNTQALALMNPDQQEKAGLNENQYGTIAAQGAQSRKTEGMREKFEGDQNQKDRDSREFIAGLRTDGLKNGKVDKEATGAFVTKIYNDMISGNKTDDYDPTHPFVAPNTSNPNVQNSILQEIYGDNTKFKHTKKDITGTDIVSEDLPTISVIGNRMSNNGKVLVERIDNRTGRILPPLYRDPEQFKSELSGILGAKLAPQVAEAAKEYEAKNKPPAAPVVDESNNLLPTISNDNDYNALPKGAKFTAPDGKIYIKN